MTPGSLVAFGGVLVFGIVGSVIIVVMTRPRRRIAEAPAGPLSKEIDAGLAEAESAARRVESAIAKVRTRIAL